MKLKRKYRTSVPGTRLHRLPTLRVRPSRLRFELGSAVRRTRRICEYCFCSLILLANFDQCASLGTCFVYQIKPGGTRIVDDALGFLLEDWRRPDQTRSN